MAGDLILRTELIKYLGCWMDSGLTFKHNISKKCQSVVLNLKRTRSIRHLINTEMAASLYLSLYISHMDYCNSVLYGLPDSSINRLQRIQNMCTCLVLRKGQCDSATAHLKELQWLPIKQWIEFKILTLTYKCLQKQGPTYLCDLIHRKQTPRQGLHSSKMDLLLIP